MTEQKPTFKNRANPEHKVGDKTVWESRSVAVIGVILATYRDSIFVLAEKRSAIMDAPGKWCLVSGYIDWDEDGPEALEREAYEETTFYMTKFANRLVFNNDGQPFYVNTNPKENRQNVAITFCYIYDFSDGLPRYVEKHKDKETDQIKWIEISEVFDPKYSWAFSHDERISMAIEKFKEYLI
jgi:8-oxo-dGTP pyrophosphatase MutT (NUDIX family)